jgi:hypothetical protein
MLLKNAKEAIVVKKRKPNEIDQTTEHNQNLTNGSGLRPVQYRSDPYVTT